MTTDKVAGRAPWHPTSREKRARCGAPDLRSPVQNACHLIFQLAAASRLLGMTKERATVALRVIAEPTHFSLPWLDRKPTRSTVEMTILFEHRIIRKSEGMHQHAPGKEGGPRDPSLLSLYVTVCVSIAGSLVAQRPLVTGAPHSQVVAGRHGTSSRIPGAG
jgi:hypothetical protein